MTSHARTIAVLRWNRISVGTLPVATRCPLLSNVTEGLANGNPLEL